MGTYSDTSASYVGNCIWWLRSPGNFSDRATKVDYDGWVDRNNKDVYSSYRGVRPALNLNLTASPDAASPNLWSYAGTVCSDGTVDETGGNVQGGYNSDGCLKLRNSCKVVKGQETFVWGTAYSDSYDKLKEVGDSLVWSSEDTSIAIVESGGYIMPSSKDGQELSMRAKVTGVTEGETNIYVEAQDGSSVRCHVIVTGSKDILFSDEKVSDSYGIMNYKKTKEGEIYYQAKALVGEYNNYIKIIQSNFKKDYQKSNISSNNYKSLRKYDESAGDRKTNQLITWDVIDTPDEAIDDTYEVLYDFLEKCLETGINNKIIDLDVDVSQSPIEIEAKIVNKIYDEIRGSSESFTGKGKNGYTVQLKTVGIFKQSFGRLTVSGGKGKRITSYNGTFCSDGKLVSQVMNQYIEDLSAQARKLYKEAAFSLWSDFRSISLLGDISEYMLKDYLQDKAEYLLQKGYGKLLTNLLKMKKGDELLKKISSAKNSESFLKVLQTLDVKEIYQEIKKVDYTDKEIKDASVKNAMGRVESARKNMESAFFDYLYNDNTMDDMNVIEKTKYYWKAIWQCPVDVTIYDENGELLGLISDSDGVVPYTDDIYMELSGDIKTVYLPKNQKVTFKLSGTDDGSMNYVVEEYEDGIAVARLNYYDVPLGKGIEYNQSVETNTLPDNISVMPLVQAEGNTIEADEYILGTDQTKNVNIIGNVEGEGVIYGDGKYAIGDAVKLAAISSNTDYRFMGWYEGDILVGYDPIYCFTALKDVTVKALFEKIQKQISDYEVKLSDKYKENARIVLYNSGENQANIVISIYDAENVSDMDIVMKKYDVKGNLADNSTVKAISDGAYRFIITDVSLDNWNTLELFDMDNDLVGIIKYGQWDEENPGLEELPTTIPSTTTEPAEIPDNSPASSPTPTTKPVYPYLPSGPSTPGTGSGAGSGTKPVSSPTPVASQTVIPTVVPTVTPGISPTPEPTIEPVETPDIIEKPLATEEPSVIPDEGKDNGTGLEDKLKKGSKVTDKKTKAVYKIIKTGKNKTVDYIKSIKKNPVSVTIPDVVKLKGKVYKVVSVGKGAFKNNKKLKTVKIGKNVQLIGKNAFSGCTGLKNVTMGKNIKTIKANAFNNCTALVIITIPSKVVKIGDKAFYKCKNIRYILVKTKKLEAGSIGNNAFGKGAVNLRVKTDKSKWKLYAGIFTEKGMSAKALYIIDPVKLVV